MSGEGARLRAEHLDLSYDGRVVASDLSVLLPPGLLSVIVGPNACGKSTLLRALTRLLTPTAGQVTLDETPLDSFAPKALARRVGLLPQSSVAPFGLCVADLVARGRFPHQRMLQQWSQEDAAAVQRAMDATGVEHLADRPVDELSGGQRQRVWLALLLAQDTPIMLLDEPTTFLDVGHQLEVLELCRRLQREEGRTLALVLHDLNQASRYADHLIVLHDGRVAACGHPSEILTTELLAEVFGLEALLLDDPVSGRPMVIPVASTATNNRSSPPNEVR